MKSWLRTTYSWVSEKNIDRYFSEFCYRINRSQNKDTIILKLFLGFFIKSLIKNGINFVNNLILKLFKNKVNE